MSDLRTHPDLRVAVVDDGAHGLRIRFGGRLTVHTAATARGAVALLTDAEATDILVDLDAVTDLDAAGVIAVTAPSMACRRAGKRVSVLGPSSPAARAAADRIGVLPLLGGGG